MNVEDFETIIAKIPILSSATLQEGSSDFPTKTAETLKSFPTKTDSQDTVEHNVEQDEKDEEDKVGVSQILVFRSHLAESKIVA